VLQPVRSEVTKMPALRSLLLRCTSPQLMLWTAPPPARECHRGGAPL